MGNENLLAEYLKAQYTVGVMSGRGIAAPALPRYSIASLRGLLEESARLQWLAASYDRFGIDLPDDIKDEIKRNERDVRASHRAELEGKLHQAQELVKELRSREEQREAAEAEIEKLKAALEGR